MSNITSVKVGTRGSLLALAQTQLVTDALSEKNPSLDFENVIIKTEGDKNESPIPLDTVGKAWFTAEIDKALIGQDIDLAVHSLKDLPLDAPAALDLRIVLERADPSDVLVTKSGSKLADLPSGAIIGTDSIRRRSLILHLRPDLKVKSLRGNVQTRLRKLHNDDYDGIILAAAGLERLGKQELAAETLDPTIFIPSIGQGTLAVEIRSSDRYLADQLTAIEDDATRIAATAERTFSRTVDAGCKLPVGCYARITGDKIELFAMLGELDGPGMLFKQAVGAATNAQALAAELGSSMLRECTFRFKPTNASH